MPDLMSAAHVSRQSWVTKQVQFNDETNRVFFRPNTSLGMFLLKCAADASLPLSGLSRSGKINLMFILCLYFVFTKIQSLRVTTIKKKYIFGKTYIIIMVVKMQL